MSFQRSRGVRTKAVLLLSATAVCATACGSSSSGSGPSSSSSSSTAASSTSTSTAPSSGSSSTASAPTGSPIKIGAVIAQTGEEGDLFGTGPATADAWAKSVNATGGIAGHPVQIISADSQSNPSAALTAAKTVVSKGAVAVLVDEAVAEGSIAPYLVSKKIPILGVGYTSAIQSSVDSYNSTASTLGTSLNELAVAQAIGKTNLSSMYCAEAPSCAQAGAFYKGNSPAYKVSFKGAYAVSASQPSYTAECLQVIKSGTNFLQIDTANVTRNTIVNTCVQQGYKGVVGALSSEINIAEMGKIPNASFAGVLNSFPWWVNEPPVNAYRAAMQKYAPTTSYANLTGTSVWSSLELFKAALAGTTGPITPATVAAAYDNVKNENLGGLLAQPVSFTAGQPPALITCTWRYTFKSGDKNPTLLPVVGTSGNGVTGPLGTSCAPKALVAANEKAAG
jgi:branched-chain amino acid transport system substrate-binding protein